MSSLPCLACGKQLEDAFEGSSGNQPYGGTAFATGGHYGSTAFDPMDGSSIEINICDPCLLAAAVTGAVLHHRRANAPWAGAAVAKPDAQTPSESSNE